MSEINCHKCDYAAKLVSADEAYYICMVENRRAADIGGENHPDWCPLIEKQSLDAKNDLDWRPLTEKQINDTPA